MNMPGISQKARWCNQAKVGFSFFKTWFFFLNWGVCVCVYVVVVGGGRVGGGGGVVHREGGEEGKDGYILLISPSEWTPQNRPLLLLTCNVQERERERVGV